MSPNVPPTDGVLDAFTPPAAAMQIEELFATGPMLVVQTAAQSHEYKKVAGSSDAAKTYDTTAA